MSGWLSGLSKNKLLITIMVLIGIALILDAAIQTFKNLDYMPFLFLSIAGFTILVMIYWFFGKDW